MPWQSVPLGEGVDQAVDERERRHGRAVDEAGVQGVVAGPQRAGHDGAAVVGDDEAPAPHPADQCVRRDLQPGLLEHLADEGCCVVLARLHASSWHRPQAAARLVGPLDQEQPSGAVVGQATHAGDRVITLRHYRLTPRVSDTLGFAVPVRYNEPRLVVSNARTVVWMNVRKILGTLAI